MTPKLWLTVAEGAVYANLCRDTIYRSGERGELRHVRVGGRQMIRLRTEWIDAWLP
jgi:excisionase family DNA binding protein